MSCNDSATNRALCKLTKRHELETIDFQITINTTFHGELYLVLHYKDSNGIYDFNDYLVPTYH